MMHRGMEIKVTRFRGRCSCSARREVLRYWGLFGYPFPPIPCRHIPYIHDIILRSACTCCTIHDMYTCPTHMLIHIHCKSIIYCIQKYCIYPLSYRIHLSYTRLICIDFDNIFHLFMLHNRYSVGCKR